ncbi:hypothetical protein [Okeania sp. SIO3B5]|nr:hypothetical protein [Okeania sp. SIO3B5]
MERNKLDSVEAIAYLGFAYGKSFCWGRRQETGDNPPLTPPRRGRQEK